MSETRGTGVDQVGPGDGLDEVDEIDVAVLAYRDDDDWQVEELPDDALVSVAAIAEELRRCPGEDGALALVSVAEDFALLVRADDASVRVLLSDVSAATDWSLARSVTDHLGVVVDDDDEDETSPAGDLRILDDLGMSARELGELLDDDELFPEELLSEVADAAGFGPAFDDLVELDD